jgi:hypothetical protein
MHVEKALFFVYLYIEAGRRDILLRKEVEGRRACPKSCLAKEGGGREKSVSKVLSC